MRNILAIILSMGTISTAAATINCDDLHVFEEDSEEQLKLEAYCNMLEGDTSSEMKACLYQLGERAFSYCYDNEKSPLINVYVSPWGSVDCDDDGCFLDPFENLMFINYYCETTVCAQK